MKIIIFLFFLTHSSFSFSSIDYGGVTFELERRPELLDDALVNVKMDCDFLVLQGIYMGKSETGDYILRPFFNYSQLNPQFAHGFYNESYGNFSECVAIGFFKFTDTPVPQSLFANGQVYEYFFTRKKSPLDLPNCPDGSPVSIKSFYPGDVVSFISHSQCVSDFVAWGYYTQDEILSSCPNAAIYDVQYALIVCPVYIPPYETASQKTVQKTNDLLSESNSKLGSIASSSSKITDLLNSIKNLLGSLSSKNFGVFGTNANSSNPSNKDNPDSPEFEPTLSNSTTDVSKISPLLSEDASCPTDISISIMNSTHYVSYQPICDFAEMLRPLVIAAARVTAAWLVIGAL